MTWLHAIIQSYLLLKHPYKLAFQPHFYRCSRCQLCSAVPDDLCAPEKVDWEGPKE